MRYVIFSVAALLCAGPAAAGGWAGGSGGGGAYPLCTDLAAAGHVAAGASCVDANGVVVTVTAEATARKRLICPYPHRPSDSVFVNGSGYILKDSVRRSIGCL